MTRLQQCWTMIGTCSMVSALVFGAPGQEAGASKLLRVHKIRSDKINPPDLQGKNPRAGTNDRWYQLTTEYQTSPDWMDDLSVTYYVLFKPHSKTSGKREGLSSYLLLQGRSEYVNIKRGRHISEMYIHPNTVDRYGSIKRIGVVFRSEGRLLSAAQSDSKSQTAWWEKLSPIDGLVLRREVTPFNSISPDHYESSKDIQSSSR